MVAKVLVDVRQLTTQHTRTTGTRYLVRRKRLKMAKKRTKTVSASDILFAKCARSINWQVVDNWRAKLGAESNMEMCFDYDSGEYYETRQLTRRSPFQSHVRKNLDHMIHTGVMDPSNQEQILKEFKAKGGTLQMLTRSIDYVEGA
jgi:hypothetical protein